eukprot:g7580.t1
MRQYVHDSCTQPAAQCDDDAAYECELFAVINHHGTLMSGHYTAFVQAGGQWFKCDDQWVSCATEAEVLQSQGYLLFYARRCLVYEQ